MYNAFKYFVQIFQPVGTMPVDNDLLIIKATGFKILSLLEDLVEDRRYPMPFYDLIFSSIADFRWCNRAK